MSTIIIDNEKCRRCGICSQVCPMRVLRMDEAGKIHTVDGYELLCLGCGHCAAVCPEAAISVDGVAGEQMKPAVVDPNERQIFEQLVRRRRSIRAYKPDTVPAGELQRLIDVTRWAPTAKNSQAVCWTVIQSPERVHKLAGMVVDWFREIGVTGIVKAWEAGKDIILRNAPHLVIAHAPGDAFMPKTDCAIAMTLLDLAAIASGLGTCWAGFFMNAADAWAPIAREIKLPENHRVCGALMIGYPVYHFKRVPPRNDCNITFLT
ncbi:MAG: nitroreductase family protein [Desulfobacterales bacterium]|nr:nitroreductase family protein [Desulfobacterales bacterium]MDD4071755.1 nitroreductase family protein [Desulfobacterales bacterium]MDD4391965.1 nitroreductase family protein [Desulfobacterales bacterium]